MEVLFFSLLAAVLLVEAASFLSSTIITARKQTNACSDTPVRRIANPVPALGRQDADPDQGHHRPRRQNLHRRPQGCADRPHGDDEPAGVQPTGTAAAHPSVAQPANEPKPAACELTQAVADALVPPAQWATDETVRIRTEAMAEALLLIHRHEMKLLVPTDRVGLLVFTLCHPSIRPLVSGNLLRWCRDSVQQLPLDDLQRDRLLSALGLPR